MYYTNHFPKYVQGSHFLAIRYHTVYVLPVTSEFIVLYVIYIDCLLDGIKRVECRC